MAAIHGQMGAGKRSITSETLHGLIDPNDVAEIIFDWNGILVMISVIRGPHARGRRLPPNCACWPAARPGGETYTLVP